MPDFVKYNPLNGYIIRKWFSVDPNVVENETNVILIDRPTYKSLTKFHKVDGNSVRLMTQVEKDILLQEEADAKAQALEEATQELRLEMREVITALIQVINQRLPQGEKITREELILQIKDNRN